MSNPIAENAHYFARRKRLTEDYRDADLQAPPSFDPRTQWRRVVNRLSTATDDQDNDRSSFSDEERSRDTFQLLRGYRPERFEQETQQQQVQDDDDALPSAHDLEHGQDETGDSDNFFAHPFRQEDQRQHGPKRTMRIFLPQPDSPPLAAAPTPPQPPTEEEETSDRTKNRWSKTIDRIKLVANLQTFHERAGGLIPSEDTSLAPYYPPLFEPSFISLSVDEYGRKLPPILLPMLNVAVTDSEYIARGVNQWVFRVELNYGDIKWVIRRSIADFVSLHYTLKFKSSLSDNVPAPPPFPDQVGSLLDSARTTIGLDRSTDGLGNANGTDTQASRGDIEAENEKRETALNRRIALTDYLRALLGKSHLTVSYDICEFLEVSAVSIVQDMGWKGKEGFMENRVRNLNPNVCQLWKSHKWTKQWVLLRDSYIAFCEDIASPSPSEVLLLDRTFKVTVSELTLLGSYHMTLATQFRHIELKGSLRQVDEWRESIAKVQSDSPWVKPHRFDSFAPIRYKAKVKWFVDGENHFNAVAEAILSAKSEIYIADWWLTPELYLRRPPEKNQEFRIDRLLQRKAREGVMIYIIIYKEMSLALTIDSAHTKQWLQSLHPNIIVQRHPDRRPFENSVLFWSHHEKIVVVDNRVALVGGLDLCFGRFDTHAHRHADYPAKGHQYQMFPGQDYSSPRVKDFANVTQHDMTLVDRELTPRMPWHDMSVAVVGPIARDVARLFIQRWNFLKASKSMHRPTEPYLMPKGEYVAQRDESKFEGTCRVQLLRSAATWSSAIAREHSIYNAYVECISRAKHFIYIENQFFITATGEDKIVRNKIGQAIVERIKRAHYDGEKFKVFILIPLIPAFEGDLTSGDSAAARGVMHFQYTSISRGGKSIVEKLREEGIDPFEYIGWYSLRNWDKIEPRLPRKKKSSESGVATSPPSSEHHRTHHQVESLSVQDPAGHEDDEMDDRDHYVSELVYIHDKLMIVDDRLVILGSANINDRSMLGNRDSEVAMLIEDTELVPSYMNGQEYQASKFALSLRIQLWKEHLGLLDFEDWESLLDPNDENLVQNCCAPAPELTNEQPPSTQHDTTVNHNNSNNDDEIRDYEADEAVRLLDRVSRTRSVYDSLKHHHYQPALKREAAALDPLTDRCYYNIWRRTAETNTLVYRDLFRTVPDDTVHTFEEHRRFVASDVPYGHIADPNRTSEDIRKKLSAIRGHLVQFPIEYLRNENLLNVIESMAPMVIFT